MEGQIFFSSLKKLKTIQNGFQKLQLEEDLTSWQNLWNCFELSSSCHQSINWKPIYKSDKIYDIRESYKNRDGKKFVIINLKHWLSLYERKSWKSCFLYHWADHPYDPLRMIIIFQIPMIDQLKMMIIFQIPMIRSRMMMIILQILGSTEMRCIVGRRAARTEWEGEKWIWTRSTIKHSNARHALRKFCLFLRCDNISQFNPCQSVKLSESRDIWGYLRDILGITGGYWGYKGEILGISLEYLGAHHKLKVYFGWRKYALCWRYDWWKWKIGNTETHVSVMTLGLGG